MIRLQRGAGAHPESHAVPLLRPDGCQIREEEPEITAQPPVLRAASCEQTSQQLICEFSLNATRARGFSGSHGQWVT